MAAAALGEEDVAREKLHPRLVTGGGLAVASDAHVAGGDAAHRVISREQDLSGGKAGEDLYPEPLGLLGEPAADVAKAHYVVPVVAETRGEHEAGHLPRRALREKNEAILADRRIERRVELFPVRDELVQRARVHHRAGQDVRADFRSLFQHAHADLVLLLRSELLQADRRGEPRRARPDDHYVVLHYFALRFFTHMKSLDIIEGIAASYALDGAARGS
jgi:hypothetical protein